MVMNGAANRDPRQFERARRIRCRPPKCPPSHRVRARYPLLPRRAAGPCGGPGLPRTPARPHHRHQDLGGQSTVPPTPGATRYVPTYILRGLTELHLEFTRRRGHAPMRAAVDDQRCRGHGVCITICPEVFDPHRRRLRGRAEPRYPWNSRRRFPRPSQAARSRPSRRNEVLGRPTSPAPAQSRPSPWFRPSGSPPCPAAGSHPSFQACRARRGPVGRRGPVPISVHRE